MAEHFTIFRLESFYFLNMTKFTQWRAALEVLRQNLNVTEASKRLFISQSVISKQIRALESELGVKIFERNGKRFVGTTRVGKKLLQMAARLIEDAHNMERAAREFSGDSGIIRIASTHFLLAHVLPPILKKFQEMQPQTQIVVEEGTPPQIAPWVESGEVDWGVQISAHFEENPALVALPFAEFSFVLIAHPNFPGLEELLNSSPFKLENLNPFPLILPPPSLDVRAKMEKVLDYYHLKPKIIFNALTVEAMKIWVLNQFGLAMIPENALNEKEKAEFKVFNISSFFPKIQARILIRRGAFLRRADYAFIQLFASHFTMAVIDSALNGNARDDFL